jgi:hypothetical protein
MLANWLQSGDRFVPVHEPTTQATHWGEGIALTGCSTGSGSMTTLTCNGTSGSPGVTNNTCPPDWLSNFIGMFFTALHGWSGVPSGIIYGVTVNSSEMQGAAAFNYAYSFAQRLASITPTPPSIGMDIYSFGPTDQSLYVRTIAHTHSFGETAFVEEFGPQAWTLSGGQTGGACAIIGLQSCAWNALNQNFFSSLLSFLASQGVTDASLFGTEMLGACAPIPPDNGQNITAVTAATTAMQNHQYSLASTSLAAILSQWSMSTLCGSKLSGLVSLIP